MHDDDLRNFFDEDAYKELLDTYAEEDSRKERERARREQQAKAPSAQPSRKTPPAKKAPASRSAQPPREHTRPALASHNARPAASPKHDEPQPVRKTEGFKLEIKGLDEEFNTPPSQKRAPKAHPTYFTPKPQQNAPAAGQKHAHAQSKAGTFQDFRKLLKNVIKSKNPQKKRLPKKLRQTRAVP